MHSYRSMFGCFARLEIAIWRAGSRSNRILLRAADLKLQGGWLPTHISRFCECRSRHSERPTEASSATDAESTRCHYAPVIVLMPVNRSVLAVTGRGL